MDCGQSFVFVGLLLLHVGTFSPVRGCRDEVYQSDGLINVSRCDTQKLVLGWNINQHIYDIDLGYLCVNPSGVNVSTPYLYGFTAQVSSTTVKGVRASVGATCWFWACYRADDANDIFNFRIDPSFLHLWCISIADIFADSTRTSKHSVQSLASLSSKLSSNTISISYCHK
ncbi:hypothetical protein EMCRGX_G015279 [Ephydatia muelleri]